MKTIYAITAMMLLSGCTTAIRGENQVIPIDVKPKGATVKVVGGPECKSPCQLTLPRKNDYVLKLTAPRCEAKEVMLQRKVDGAAWWFSGVYDYNTGAAYTLYPQTINDELECK